MVRIQAVTIQLSYISSEISKEEIEDLFQQLGVESYLISEEKLGVYRCLLYNKKKFDIYSCKKFVVRDVMPEGEAVKPETLDNLKLKLANLDPGLITFGEKMQVDSKLLDKVVRKQMTSSDKEIERLKIELEKAKKKIKKLKNVKQITFGDIIVYNTTFNVKVNNLKEETLDHLKFDDRREILQQEDCDTMALRAIEKVHFNTNSRDNNNVFVTNIKEKRVHVRENNEWKSDENYTRVFNAMANNVPNHIKTILSTYNRPLPLPRCKIEKAIKGIKHPDSIARIRSKIPDIAYSYTKSLIETIKNEGSVNDDYELSLPIEEYQEREVDEPVQDVTVQPLFVEFTYEELIQMKGLLAEAIKLTGSFYISYQELFHVKSLLLIIMDKVTGKFVGEKN